VASYATYLEAQRAVDHLADHKFPVERTAIVGEGLRIVEQVTGRVGYPQAALSGALSGAFAGALIGWIFGVFSWVDPLVSGLALALYGLLIGAVIGLVFGLLSHALAGGRRDFGSISGIQADHFNLTADDEVADQARSLLDGLR